MAHHYNIMKMGAVALVIPFLLGNQGGCGTTAEPPVKVVADSFCLAAKKRSWSIDDTPETVAEAVRVNAGIDKACGRRS
jgi:hypothetical protein